MSCYRVIPLGVLLFFCYLAGVSESLMHDKEEVYGPVIENICRGSDKNNSCTQCLSKIMNANVIALNEVDPNVSDNLKLCLKNASKEFHNFQCRLLDKQSYTFGDYLDENCLQALQNKTPFFDLNVDLSKAKSHFGYFNLGEVTVTTLMGILKYANDSNNINSLKVPKLGNPGVCKLIESSNFLSSLSQANGNSWELDLDKRAPLFFEAINEKVCNGNKTCLECLSDILNVETIMPKETTGENFMKLLSCKRFVPESVNQYLSSIKHKDYNLEKQIPESCVNYLRDKVSYFKFEKHLNISDLAKDTFYIQEIIKFGIDTVFYYLHETKGLIPDDMRSGVCKKVILPYTKAIKYAMQSFNALYESEHDPYLQSKSPYKKMFERVCGEDNKYCRACHEKVGYSVNVKFPREPSDIVIDVLDHCKIYQSEGFKKFTSRSKHTSFKACLKSDTYGELFNGYPMNNEVNILTTLTRPNFPNYEKFLHLGYYGICYYYKVSKERETIKDKVNLKPIYDPVELYTKLRTSELPEAYLYVMPELNLRSVSNISDCDGAYY